MDANEDELTRAQSLQIISEMIAAAKSEINDNGFFFLLWG